MEALSYSQGRYQNENSSWIIEEYPKGNFVVSKYTGLYPKEGKENLVNWNILVTSYQIKRA